MILYKYYGYKAGLDALKSQQVGFREPRYFNDPFELSYHEATHTNRFLLSQVNKIKNSVAILSLTRTPYNPLMWAHYGEEHRGFVIGYDVSGDFFQSCEYNLVPAHSGDVIYTSSKEASLSHAKLQELTHKAYLIASGMSKSEISSAEPVEIENFLKTTLLYKHSCWSYEEEVRVIKILQSDFTSCEEWQSDPYRNFRDISNNFAPGISYPKIEGLNIFTHKVPITEVYLGLRNPLRTPQEGHGSVSDELEILATQENWRVFNMEMSQGSWGLTTEQTTSQALQQKQQTLGALNTFSCSGKEADTLRNSLNDVSLSDTDRIELTNWSRGIHIKLNGSFVYNDDN